MGSDIWGRGGGGMEAKTKAKDPTLSVASLPCASKMFTSLHSIGPTHQLLVKLENLAS